MTVADTVRAVDRPAIAGGEKAKRTPYGAQQRYGEDELKELREALEQNTLFYAHGRKVSQLESEFAEKAGVRFAIACNSGTSAIHSACIALGISPGDEVIVSPITDMGSLVPILYQGAVPVFADLTPHGYTLDPGSVESLIGPRTRAIIAVHLGGNACDLDALQAICRRHDVALIEDCAQALGCSYRGRKIGTIGKVGCFSLNEFKHISCGDGGMMVTDDEELSHRLRLGTDKCYERRPDALEKEPVFLANNYRMTELQGAVGRAQLRKLDDIVARRRHWSEGLAARLSVAAGIALAEPTSGCDPSWWFFMFRVEPELNADADAFAAALRAEGVNCGAHYIGTPVYRYPIFRDHTAFARGGHAYEARDYGRESCPVAEAILQTCVMFNVHEAYTETDADEIAHAITRAAAWFRSGAVAEIRV